LIIYIDVVFDFVDAFYIEIVSTCFGASLIYKSFVF
jgi:hypothetical protein